MDSRFLSEFRSPLARDARTLLNRVVDTVAKAKSQYARSLESLDQSMERVQWSDQLVGRSVAIRDRLRDTVAALAASERAKGVPPERMLIELKNMVLEVEDDRLDVPLARSLMDDVVRWGIEAYYAA